MPSDQGDPVLAAIRELQEDELRATEEGAVADHEREILYAANRERIAALQPAFDRFLREMDAAGNPGIHHQHATDVGYPYPPEERPKRIPAMDFWPLARLKYVGVENETRRIVALTSTGKWWWGTVRYSKRDIRPSSCSVLKPINLYEFNWQEPTFDSFEYSKEKVPIGEAIVFSMAEFTRKAGIR